MIFNCTWGAEGATVLGTEKAERELTGAEGEDGSRVEGQRIDLSHQES